MTTDDEEGALAAARLQSEKMTPDDDGDGDGGGAAPSARSFGDALRTNDPDLIADALDADSVDLDAGDERSNAETAVMQLCHSELDDDDAAAMLELMLLRAPDVGRRDADGRTALCHACMTGRTYFVQRLAHVGRCEPNAADAYGNTALMFAAYSGQLDVVRLLIESFAANGKEVDIARRNDEGIDAIGIAERYGYTDIVELLSRCLSERARDDAATRREDDRGEGGFDVDCDADTRGDADADDRPYVGCKAQKFRRRKFKPAGAVPSLGPLIVQNRLQSSKSVDYVQNYRETSAAKDGVRRQHSSSAVTCGQYDGAFDVSERLRYQSDHYDEVYLAEDEQSDTSSSDDEQCSTARYVRRPSLERTTSGDAADETVVLGEERRDDGRRSPTVGRRKPSVSLPDLRNKPAPPSGGYYDSGYDTHSGRLTTTREDLSLPEIPEPDSSSNEDDYTPRTRRDSLSLPDLRGLRPSLVGSASGVDGSRRLNLKQIPKAPLVDIRSNEVVHDLRNELELSDDDAFATTTAGGSGSGERQVGLTLPSVAETNRVIAPSAPTEPKEFASRRYKAWNTPRPNNTSRAPTMSELNKKIAGRHQVLTDRA